ncbi:hypothetical protein DdX_14674 [Ditylenchus destructor]|uniref:F-box domain-containing protein n=1 Tax=Ditylenchus destructor TaxID=166010 RepID=A0AAD4QYF3_9BILA|nr:hypothetical protein DdX_14674 [Ditylenchus destructor]
MSKIDTGQGVKQPGSAIASASDSDVKQRSRNPVEIPEDVWLDALKHLPCPKWSKMRLVSHQLNGMVERNVSRLPLAIIHSVEIRLKERKNTEGIMIVSDSTILPEEKDQWFQDRDIAFDFLADIQLDDAIIGVELKKNSCADLCALGPAQEKKLTRYEKRRPWFSGQRFNVNVIFYAEFSPHRNKYSWASMAFFLKLLYDPSTYVKNLSMYALNKKMKEVLFANEEKRYIRCGSFKLQVPDDASIEDICESVSWLEQNVQADIVQFPDGIRICDALTNYLLGSSWISANQVVKLEEINGKDYFNERFNNAERYFGILIKKFPTVAVQSIFPTVVFSGNEPLCWDSLNNQLSGNSIVNVKLEDPENDGGDSQYNASYTISNGSNRMRIKFIRLHLTSIS